MVEYATIGGERKELRAEAQPEDRQPSSQRRPHQLELIDEKRKCRQVRDAHLAT